MNTLLSTSLQIIWTSLRFIIASQSPKYLVYHLPMHQIVPRGLLLKPYTKPPRKRFHGLHFFTQSNSPILVVFYILEIKLAIVIPFLEPYIKPLSPRSTLCPVDLGIKNTSSNILGVTVGDGSKSCGLISETTLKVPPPTCSAKFFVVLFRRPEWFLSLFMQISREVYDLREKLSGPKFFLIKFATR